MTIRLIILAQLILFSATGLFGNNREVLPIVPKPQQVIITGEEIRFDKNWEVYVDPKASMASTFIASVLKECGVQTHFTDNKRNANIIFQIDKKISTNPEAYHLTVSGKRKITAAASSDNGLLYALQTLRQIITHRENKIVVPSCRINDEPAFSWRAFMLDESRHFQGMETVKKLLDEMSYLKMNTFHWHLVDDTGWRIEIKKYPGLTTVGSRRDFSYREFTLEQWDEKFPGRKMYYTQDEIREIVRYASDRGIKVVPEIEVPGHASASIAAYPWLGASSKEQGSGIWGDLYNVTDPKVEAFIQDVLDEVITLFPSKIIHIGGDEANYTHWQNNPQIMQFMKDHAIPTFADLQVWSINRFSKYLTSKDVRMMGWNEITGENIRGEAHIKASQTEQLAEGTLVHFWDGDISLINKAIDRGFEVVNSNRHDTYLDYSYEVTPLLKAYSFNPIPEGLGKENEAKIVGLGCQMWGEYTPNLTRLYYQIFPRIAAYAESGWTIAENKDYDEFSVRMKNTENRWRKSGYFNQQPSYSVQDDTFTLWQLPSQNNNIDNAYLIQTPQSQDLEKAFVNPPDSVQTSVYWYWISDNISKEGAVKDLQAMKKAGINRAFIGNIGIQELPYGTVKMFSDEWWEILHLALKTATDLDIEIGIFNSPGWSQSGGPWIKPEESMRYLASSETIVKGPQKIKQALKKPNKEFQDLKVLALPYKAHDGMILNHSNAAIESFPSLANLSLLTDNDPLTGIKLPDGNHVSITFKTRQPYTARSISLQITESPLMADVELQIKAENNEFKTISQFLINRSNPALNVGFDPYAPVVISLPATTAEEFRLNLTYHNSGAGLAEVIISTLPRVERFSEKSLAKMHPTPLPYWDAYLWAEQPEVDDQSLVIQEHQILDISAHMTAEGLLTWDVPEGEWMILRMGMSPTQVTNSPASPEATGLEVDKMSKKWVAVHFDKFIGEILRRIPEEDRKTFKVVVQDSYETGGQNFTDNLMEEFADRYGYDPFPYLPVFRGYVVNSPLASDRFLWDLRRMIADKVAYDYVGGLRDVSHQYGLTTWLENYGHWGFPGEFLMYGGQSDEIGGEFWSQGELGDIENRAATSAGHIYGKTKISAESNTSGGPAYSRYPAMMKQRSDRFFAEGINNTLLHVYIMQPYEDKSPGVNAWFGNEFDRKNSWFSQMDVFTHYLKRTNFMLQQGLNVADVAYFIGEDAPKMTGVADPKLPLGYQFDYINAEVILRDMTVEDGKLTLPHGTQYRVLVLPKQETMRPELLAKIKQLVNDGATVLGPAPSLSPSLQNQPDADKQVSEMAEELWGEVDGVNVKERKYGKGYMMSGMELNEVFSVLECIPDCKVPEDNTIHYGHRSMEGIDIYFVSNQTDETKVIQPAFRVTGKQPELWEATTGAIRDLPAFEVRGKATIVPLKLAPFESVFVVFRKRAGSNSLTEITNNYPEPSSTNELKGPWKVYFDPSLRGPATPVIFETLQDWTTSQNESIKYYSGTARYTIEFVTPRRKENETVVIDLGNLTAMAKVKVNGTYAGGLWTYPYRLNITALLKSGNNVLEIEVVNNWMNRLIGDMNLPEAQRETWCFVNPYTPQSPLQPSGLFGPVTIQTIQYNKLNKR